MLTVRRAPRRRVAVPATLGSLESTAALALAHAAAGGEALEPWWLAAFGLLVYAASGVVLRRRAGIRVVLPALLLAQVLGHAWLVALTPSAHAVHGAHGHEASGLPALLGLTAPMLLAHLAAAAVTGGMWVLRRRAVEVLLGWVDTGRLPAAATPGAVVRTRVVPPRALRLVAVAPTRGPPAGMPATA